MTAEERRRGRLKVFLGAAAGVGKTFAMLGEARDLKAAGVDVVVGYLEPDGVHRAVEAAEELGRQLGATVLRRTGDVAATVVATAGELAVNQIVLGESHRPRWKELVGRSIIARILRETDGVDVHIIADRGGRSDGPQREKP